jgi:hypothetical protein
MNRESEQYRFARIEGYRMTLSRLEERFKDSAVNVEEMEAAAAEQLSNRTLCAPWRRSEEERAGCHEGMRLAAVQFLSPYRDATRNLRLNRPV